MLVSKMYSTPKVAKFLQYRLAWYLNLPQYWWGVRPVLFFGESCWMCVVWVRLKNEVKNIWWTCTQKARTRSKEESGERKVAVFEESSALFFSSSSLFHYFLKVVIIYRHFYEKRSTASCGLPYSAKVRHISDFSNR